MCVHAREKSQRQLVMLVMFRARRGRSSTDTLIAGLAVADFFTSVFVVPFPKAEAIPDTSTAQFYCRVIYSGVIMWTARCASIFILTTISVERLTAVRYPFVFQRLFTPRQTMIAIHIIWITSFILNTLWIYVIFIEGNKCTLEFPSDPFQSFIGVSYFLIKYLFPVGIMVCAHTLTIRSLRERAEVLRAGRKQRDLKLLEARRRVIETLIIVVVIFTICWTPDQIVYLANALGLLHKDYTYGDLERALLALAFINCAVNPVIYAARNRHFREALKQLFGVMSHFTHQHIFAETDDNQDRSATSSAFLSVNESNVVTSVGNVAGPKHLPQYTSQP